MYYILHYVLNCNNNVVTVLYESTWVHITPRHKFKPIDIHTHIYTHPLAIGGSDNALTLLGHARVVPGSLCISYRMLGMNWCFFAVTKIHVRRKLFVKESSPIFKKSQEMNFSLFFQTPPWETSMGILEFFILIVNISTANTILNVRVLI